MIGWQQNISLPNTGQGKKTDRIYNVSPKKLRAHSVNTEQAQEVKTQHVTNHCTTNTQPDCHAVSLSVAVKNM